MNLERINKIKEHMTQSGYQTLLLTSTDAIYYLTGHEIHPGERLMALVISEEKTHFVLNELFPLTDDTLEIEAYKDSDDSIAFLQTFIPEDHVVGIDKEWPSRFLISLMEKRPDLTFKNGSHCVDQVRLIKDADEIVKMKAASVINDQVISEIYNAIKYDLNVTEAQVCEWVDEKNSNLGVHELSFDSLVCFGENCAEPHHDSDGTLLKMGDAIIVDIGGRKDGYCSDMTRSFYYGTPSEEYVKVYNTVLKANLSAIAKVKPGVKLSDVDAAARNVIVDAGYGDFFTHRTGHGCGITVHEFPDVSAANDMVCQPGMIFSIEPGIYLPQQFGVRIEDLVLVTEDGCEVLNAYPKNLQTL